MKSRVDVKMRKIDTDMRGRMQEKKEPGDRRGQLITGSFDETMEELKKLIDEEKPPKIIAVGDCVSENMINHNLLPHILVVDNQIMREKIDPVVMNVDQTLRVKNPAKTLTNETFSAMQEALKSGKRTRILVDGEEDLVTIVAVLYAPLGSFVIYGQPREGIVVVRVTEARKEGMQRLVERMQGQS